MKGKSKATHIEAEIIDFYIPRSLTDPGTYAFTMCGRENYYYSVVKYRYRELEYTGKIYRCKQDYIGRTTYIDIKENNRICRTESVADSPYIAEYYIGVFIFEPIAAIAIFIFCLVLC